MITLSRNSDQSLFDSVYDAPVGEIIKIEGDDYEFVLEKIQNNIPAGKTFRVREILQGTELFTSTGPHCLIVAETETSEG